MRELLPLFLAAALGNHLLLRVLLPADAPRGAASGWPAAGALLALAAAAFAPRLAPAVAGLLCLSALAAVAACLAQADARAPGAAPFWRRHLHALAAIAGANLGGLAYALAAGRPAGAALPTCLAATLLLALLVAAAPAFAARIGQAGPRAAWPAGPLSCLGAALVGLALSGLGRLLPW